VTLAGRLWPFAALDLRVWADPFRHRPSDQPLGKDAPHLFFRL